jgi:type II secretory pathway pseudopilin PulG
MFKKLLSNQKGQSLVELLIAIGLATLLLPAILTGLSASRGGRAQHDQRLEAATYLKQAQEAVRSVGQKSWSNLSTNGIYHPVISNGTWELAPGTQVVNNYTLSISIEDVLRSTGGEIVESGGIVDPSTKKVVVSVTWNTPILSTASATSYFTRHRNNAYSETSNTHFNAGTLTNLQVTNTNGGEIKLSNNNKAKWCSPSMSSSTIDLPDGPPVAVAAAANTSSAVPNDVFVATSPTTSNSIKLAYVNVTANTETPVTSLKGKFTMDPAAYSSSSYLPSGTNLTNSFKTNDVKYYKSSSGKTYALLATDLPDKEVIAVMVNDGDPSNDESTTGEFQDPVNDIYKYHTFFNTKMYEGQSITDTGFRSPSSHSADSGGDGNGFQTNPTNAYSSNGTFAVDTDSGNGTGINCTGIDKDKHRYYNYNFSVPSAAEVNGIQVRLDARADSTSGTPRMCVQLSWDGGTTWTTAKTSNNLTTSEATYSLGGSADNWGRSWSSGDFTNANFRVRVINIASNTSRDFSLEWLGVKLFYNDGNLDQAPYGYGGVSLGVSGDRGYVASGGYLYAFNLSDIDTKTTSSGLDMLGCRIQLDGYDCRPGSPADADKYSSGESGTTWSDNTSAIHNDCSDGGNIELYATNDIYPVDLSNNKYVYVAVGGVTNPEFAIVNTTNVPSGSSSPAINNNSCGRISGGNNGWRQVSVYDFNSDSNTEEAANSVYANSQGSRAYISSNGGIDGNGDGQGDSKQFYILNTTNKLEPTFLTGNSDIGPGSGFYQATGANGEMFPRRSLTVLNGDRVVLVGSDGTANANDAAEYQVLNSENESTPAYCAGIDFDQGFNDLTSVSEADFDNFVYMVANTTANELKIVEGGSDDAIYVSSGTFTSQIFDAGSEVMVNRLFSTSNSPSQTTLNYQVAIADPVSGSCSSANYVYVGPDGTSGSYFNSTSELPRNNDGTGYENPGRCMRYRVYMSSVDQMQTPTLFDFGFNFSP